VLSPGRIEKVFRLPSSLAQELSYGHVVMRKQALETRSKFKVLAQHRKLRAPGRGGFPLPLVMLVECGSLLPASPYDRVFAGRT